MELSDFLALLDGGGVGGVIAFFLYKQSKSSQELVGIMKKGEDARKRMQDAQLKHFSQEEDMYRELRDERAQWAASADAKVEIRRATMEMRAQVDASQDQLERALDKLHELRKNETG